MVTKCWINASITALFACPWIRGHLREILESAVNTAHLHYDESRIYRELKALAASSSDCKARDSLRGSTQLRLALTYEQAMTNSHGGLGFVPWLMWNQFYRGAEEDAQEFIQNLLDPNQSPNLRLLFCGRNDPVFICQNPACPHRTPVTGGEDFVTLPIDIDTSNSLQAAVTAFIHVQEIVNLQGWKCSACSDTRSPRKQNEITRYPPMLFMQLKRFRTIPQPQHPDGFEEIYLTHHVVCEEELRLGNETYRLLAKIYHCGESLRSGHYYTICRHAHAGGDWWCYNDIHRRLARPEDDNSSYARVYLCIYEKVSD